MGILWGPLLLRTHAIPSGLFQRLGVSDKHSLLRPLNTEVTTQMTTKLNVTVFKGTLTV